jgi:uncharacterized protein YpmB
MNHDMQVKNPEIIENQITIEQKDSIKLTKNTKGYGWEIKLLEKEGRDLLKELKLRNDEMIKEYGSKE